VLRVQFFWSGEAAKTNPRSSPLLIFAFACATAAFAASGRPATRYGSNAASLVVRSGKALVDCAEASDVEPSASAANAKVSARLRQRIIGAASPPVILAFSMRARLWQWRRRQLEGLARSRLKRGRQVSQSFDRECGSKGSVSV
jgi:hypothetical protein